MNNQASKLGGSESLKGKGGHYADIVRTEHLVEMFRLLGGGVVGDTVGMPNARLAILPGTTHVSLVQRADWLVPMINEFLG